MGGSKRARRPKDVKIPISKPIGLATRDTDSPSPLLGPTSPINRSYSTSSLRKALESPPPLPPPRHHRAKPQKSVELQLRQSELQVFQDAGLPPSTVQFTPAGASRLSRPGPSFQGHARRTSQQRGDRSPYPTAPVPGSKAVVARKPVPPPRYNEEALAKLEGRHPRPKLPYTSQPSHEGRGSEAGFVTVSLDDREAAHAETLAKLEGRHVQMRPHEGRVPRRPTGRGGDVEAQVAVRRTGRHCNRKAYVIVIAAVLVAAVIGAIIGVASHHAHHV